MGLRYRYLGPAVGGTFLGLGAGFTFSTGDSAKLDSVAHEKIATRNLSKTKYHTMETWNFGVVGTEWSDWGSNGRPFNQGILGLYFTLPTGQGIGASTGKIGLTFRGAKKPKFIFLYDLLTGENSME